MDGPRDYNNNYSENSEKREAEETLLPMNIKTGMSRYDIDSIDDSRRTDALIYRFYGLASQKTWVLWGIFVTTCILFYIVYDLTHQQLVDAAAGSFRVQLLVDPERPIRLRQLISDTTRGAIKAGTLASIPLHSKFEVIREDTIGFVLSSRAPPAAAGASATTSGGMHYNYDNKPIMSGDQLNVRSMEESLVVHSFTTAPYTVTLNKFNTISEHCLLVTNDFESQLTPLSAEQLELLYWSINSIEGVGFYNSNALAGASQPRKHVQFAPLDSFWKYRSADEMYPLPLDDGVLPFIESKRWRPYIAPFLEQVNHNKHAVTTATGAVSSTAKSQAPTSSSVYTLPEFGFKHAIAVMMSRSDVLAEAKERGLSINSVQAQEHIYGQYLRAAYERLLQAVDISLEDLDVCASASQGIHGSGRKLDESDVGMMTAPLVELILGRHSNSNSLNKTTDNSAATGSTYSTTTASVDPPPPQQQQQQQTVTHSPAYYRRQHAAAATTTADGSGFAAAGGNNTSGDATHPHRHYHPLVYGADGAVHYNGGPGSHHSSINTERNRERDVSGGGSGSGSGTANAANNFHIQPQPPSKSQQPQKLSSAGSAASPAHKLMHDLVLNAAVNPVSRRRLRSVQHVDDAEVPAEEPQQQQHRETTALNCDSRESMSSQAYNLVLTNRYMMVVPRSQDTIEGISINSFGYMGYLLTTSAAQAAMIKMKGPLEVLKSAAVV